MRPPPKPSPSRSPNRVQKSVDPQQDKIAALAKENQSLRSKIEHYEITLDTLNERLASLRGQHAERVRELEMQARELEAGARLSRESGRRGSDDRDEELESARRDMVADLMGRLRQLTAENRQLRVALESVTTLVPHAEQ
jgi:TolA-binding protein